MRPAAPPCTQIPSTSYAPALPQVHTAKHSRRGLKSRAVRDDCRDKVNAPMHRESSSDTSVKVTFQGAGGQAVEVDCPEVRTGQTAYQLHEGPPLTAAAG